MKKVKLFVTVEGNNEDKLLEADPLAHVKEILSAATYAGLPIRTEGALVFLEEGEDAIELSEKIEEAGIKDESRIHISRCRKILVTVHYGRQEVEHPFPPSATVGRVQKWAAEKLLSNEIDRKEHVLEVCETDFQPTPRTQIGTLVKNGKCELCFDLVAAVRVEG